MTPTDLWKLTVSRGEGEGKKIPPHIFYYKHQSPLFHYDQSYGTAGSSELLEKLKFGLLFACFPPPWLSSHIRCALAGAADIHQTDTVPVSFAHCCIYNAIDMFGLAQNYTAASIQ